LRWKFDPRNYEEHVSAFIYKEIENMDFL